jgi:hypothetical protein
MEEPQGSIQLGIDHKVCKSYKNNMDLNNHQERGMKELILIF